MERGFDPVRQSVIIAVVADEAGQANRDFIEVRVGNADSERAHQAKRVSRPSQVITEMIVRIDVPGLAVGIDREQDSAGKLFSQRYGCPGIIIP